MSGEDAPRPYLENLIVLEIKTTTTSSKTISTLRAVWYELVQPNRTL
jgi:hypothetical protein